ncbi:unnamed protein product [Protopolystoma xenopodis]|uniref:Uncharacterized protein n=1 Tax=Protopolystoma xenopodis TaxID=117903 RepID=A0A448X5D2_9PLAT|nr:unnamed protein product [Protopolystoma xenopodis]
MLHVHEKTHKCHFFIAKLRREESRLRDCLARLEAVSEAQERDRCELGRQAAASQSAESRLSEERAGLRVDRQRLRDDLTQCQAELAVVGTEARRLADTLAQSEASRMRAEAEVEAAGRDRLELAEAMGTAERAKASLAEELAVVRRDAERHSVLAARLAGEKETLARQKAELMVQVRPVALFSHFHLSRAGRLTFSFSLYFYLYLPFLILSSLQIT